MCIWVWRFFNDGKLSRRRTQSGRTYLVFHTRNTTEEIEFMINEWPQSQKSERWSSAADSVVDESRAPVCKRSVTLSHSVVTRRVALTKSGGMVHNLAV